MNEDELNALIDAKLAARLEAELQARREQMRVEVISALRREAERAHYDRINAKHAIETPLAGLTLEQEAERQRAMDERSAATRARMDAANARPVPGQVVRGLRPKRVDGAGGSVGFRVKG
jgi:hypothetical protein